MAGEILSGLGFTDAELSIVIVSDEEMALLNGQYRQVAAPTDVLAFPLLEGEFGDVLPEMLGDVVISAPTARAMSRDHCCPLPAILDLLLVHGILHLVGYDHESDPEQARRMENKSLELLKMLGHVEQSFEWYMGGTDE